MGKPFLHELEPGQLEEAGKIAGMIVGEREYNHIRSNGGPFQREYGDLGHVELIELATDVVNGEYPDVDERFSYGDDRWTVEDFIDAAVETSTTPFSRNRKHSEMMGSTQLDDEPLELSDIAENANNFISAHVEDRPPVDKDYKVEEDKFWLDITYISQDYSFSFADYVSFAPMEDRQNPAPEAENREDIYWPE